MTASEARNASTILGLAPDRKFEECPRGLFALAFMMGDKPISVGSVDDALRLPDSARFIGATVVQRDITTA